MFAGTTVHPVLEPGHTMVAFALTTLTPFFTSCAWVKTTQWDRFQQLVVVFKLESDNLIITAPGDDINLSQRYPRFKRRLTILRNQTILQYSEFLLLFLVDVILEFGADPQVVTLINICRMSIWGPVIGKQTHVGSCYTTIQIPADTSILALPDS